jgi:hypothetical protein
VKPANAPSSAVSVKDMASPSALGTPKNAGEATSQGALIQPRKSEIIRRATTGHNPRRKDYKAASSDVISWTLAFASPKSISVLGS